MVTITIPTWLFYCAIVLIMCNPLLDVIQFVLDRRLKHYQRKLAQTPDPVLITRVAVPASNPDFYEEDEDPAKIKAIFEEGEKGFTTGPPFPYQTGDDLNRFRNT